MRKSFRYDDVPVLETTSGKLKGCFYDGTYIFKGVPRSCWCRTATGLWTSTART